MGPGAEGWAALTDSLLLAPGPPADLRSALHDGSLVLKAAAQLPPAPLPCPASGLQAEGLQLLLEGFMVHGPVVLGLTEVLGHDRGIWVNLVIMVGEVSCSQVLPE